MRDETYNYLGILEQQQMEVSATFNLEGSRRHGRRARKKQVSATNQSQGDRSGVQSQELVQENLRTREEEDGADKN